MNVIASDEALTVHLLTVHNNPGDWEGRGKRQQIKHPGGPSHPKRRGGCPSKAVHFVDGVVCGPAHLLSRAYAGPATWGRAPREYDCSSLRSGAGRGKDGRGCDERTVWRVGRHRHCQGQCDCQCQCHAGLPSVLPLLPRLLRPWFTPSNHPDQTLYPHVITTTRQERAKMRWHQRGLSSPSVAWHGAAASRRVWHPTIPNVTPEVGVVA